MKAPDHRMETVRELDMPDNDTYRLNKVMARRGWAIYQIKFEYTEGKAWSVGIDGGRKDFNLHHSNPLHWWIF